MGSFLVEGIHPIGEAFAAGWEVEHLVYAPEMLKSEFGVKLVKEQSRKGTQVVPVTTPLFENLASKENPQGILAIVKQKHKTMDQCPWEGFSLGAALVTPQDPGNLGTILRTLDAVGADGLFLLEGGVDPFHPSAVRASMGTIFWVPVYEGSFSNLVRWVKKNQITLVGTSAHASQDYHTLQKIGARRMLLLGSEQKGLSQEQMDACDVVVSLPMRGRASSLNLSVAAGILLYTLES